MGTISQLKNIQKSEAKMPAIFPPQRQLHLQKKLVQDCMFFIYLQLRKPIYFQIISLWLQNKSLQKFVFTIYGFQKRIIKEKVLL